MSRRGVSGVQLLAEAAVVGLFAKCDEWSGRFSKYLAPKVQLL